MNRRVNRLLLDEWIFKNGPHAVAKLTLQSDVATSTIEKARSTGIAPKKLDTLQRLSKSLGHNVDELFPFVKTKGTKAS